MYLLLKIHIYIYIGVFFFYCHVKVFFPMLETPMIFFERSPGKPDHPSHPGWALEVGTENHRRVAGSIVGISGVLLQ